MNAVMLLGIDLAKNVFQLHGVDARGVCQMRRQVRRAQLLWTIAIAALHDCDGSLWWCA